MREDIGLFRGRRIDNGEWVEGYLVVTPEDKEGKEFAYWIISGLDYMGSIYDAPMAAEPVDPATVGEYTGLKDKNGKRVFEGDIVVYDNTPYNAYGHRVIGAIVWRKWAWKLKYTEYGSVFHYAIGSEDFFHAKSEVIGSIHDNPELLEV